MKPLIILELANNHMGDINHASQTIDDINDFSIVKMILENK